MARMNWGKATTRSKISRHGFEQGSEFGDVIDKSRQRAAIVHAKLTSSSHPIVKPAKSERQRQHEMRMRQQPQDKKRKQLVSEKAGTRTPKAQTAAIRKRKTEFELAVLHYLQQYAVASLTKRALPDVPQVIKKRYQGKQLNSWKKLILMSDLYARACDDVTQRRLNESQR